LPTDATILSPTSQRIAAPDRLQALLDGRYADRCCRFTVLDLAAANGRLAPMLASL